MKRNPFTNRSTITASADFFGRKEILETILGRLVGPAKPQCLSVVGQRRIGKSSLFRRLAHLVTERDPEMKVAYYDLEAARKLSAERFFTEIGKRLARAAEMAAPDPSAESLAFDTLHDFLELGADRGLRFAFFLDEFDAVTSNPQFDADFFGSLRYLTNNFPIAFVTSSYEDLTELCHAEEIRQSPFFNVFTTIDLGFMEAGEAEEMLDTLIGRGEYPFSSEDKELIFHCGYLYPFFMQIAGSAVWEEKHRGRAGAGPQAIRSFREEAERHFQYFVEHLRPEERQALETASVGRAIPDRLARRLERRSLVKLQDRLWVPFSAPFCEFLRRNVKELEDATGSIVTVEVSNPRELAPGTLVERRFRVESKIGGGAMGEVWLARDTKLNRLVALKKIVSKAVGEARSNAMHRERLRAEANAVAKLSHPNIVKVFDFLTWEGQDIIEMEYVEGEDLYRLLQREGPLSVRRAASIGKDIALALAHAHEQGIIHRDVKPSNIMLDKDSRVRLMDFGLVKSSQSGPPLTEVGMILGTPPYMAPEQFGRGVVDHRTDIYGLGAVLYHLVTGRPPFSGSDVSSLVGHILLDTPPDPSSLGKEIDPLFVSVLSQSMAKSQEMRYQDAKTLALALEDVLQHLDGV